MARQQRSRATSRQSSARTQEQEQPQAKIAFWLPIEQDAKYDYSGVLEISEDLLRDLLEGMYPAAEKDGIMRQEGVFGYRLRVTLVENSYSETDSDPVFVGYVRPMQENTRGRDDRGRGRNSNRGHNDRGRDDRRSSRRSPQRDEVDY